MHLRVMIGLLCLAAAPALAADQSSPLAAPPVKPPAAPAGAPAFPNLNEPMGPPGAEIRVLVPAVVYNAGLVDLMNDYIDENGTAVSSTSGSMAKIATDAKTATPPPDVIALPGDLMDALEKEGGLLPRSRHALGRVEIGLIVRKGAPHPDISTVAKLAAVLKAADSVVYSDPARGSLVGAMAVALFKRKEFVGVKGMPSAKGDGVDALSRGEAQMALQLICEVPPAHDVENVELVGALPPELGMHIDTDVAVTARTKWADEARAFVRYITRPSTAPEWAAKGMALK